ncbi:metallophosphoesterase [Pseudonocardia phyllosphaerae]|uniref:metallophosphoesterase n=1 Tax=Pseudonocardia phyllosphaerae TaxID=3390502 RepID=UPI003979D511
MPTVLQLSDLHSGLPGWRPRAERTVAGVRALDPAPDVVLVTGDVADDGTPDQYAAAADLLDGLDAHLVPGNHDDRAALAAAFGEASDRVLQLDGATLVLLDTLVPGHHHGAVSAAGLDLLADAARDPAPLLVALHHPPVRTGHPVLDTMGVFDPGPLERVLATRADDTVVVCGHQHTPLTTTFAGHPLVLAPSVAPATAWPGQPGTSDPATVPPGGVLHVLGDGSVRSRFVCWGPGV